MRTTLKQTATSDTPLSLSGVLSKDVVEVWPEVGPLIARAIAKVNAPYRAFHVYEWLVSRDSQLWVVYDGDAIIGCVVTRICQHPARRDLEITCAAGVAAEGWVTMSLDTLEDFARANGCSEIGGAGRNGWTRMAEKHGFTKGTVSFRKKVYSNVK